MPLLPYTAKPIPTTTTSTARLGGSGTQVWQTAIPIPTTQTIQTQATKTPSSKSTVSGYS